MQLMNVRYKCVDQFGIEDFPEVIFDWITGTRDMRYRMNIVEQPFNGHVVYKDKEKELTIVEYKELHTIAALHKDRDLNGLEWSLSVVFKEDEHCIYVRLSNSDTTEEGRFMRNFRKPDIIDELVDINALQMDYDIPMEYTPHIVSKGRTDEFLSVLNKTSKFTLPVVYIAEGPYSLYGVDPDKIADTYAGMAHVFVQEGRDCFEELINGTEKYVPKNGEIAVYFPIDTAKEQHIQFNKSDIKSTEKAISKAIHYFYRNQDFGPLTTYEEIASKAISLRNSSLKEENEKINLENERVNKENEDIISTFDLDLKKSDDEMERLRARMAELEQENAILKARLEGIDNIPVLYYGKEKELYAGEIREVLTDVLLNNTTVTEDSRREHIIKDILEANKVEPTIRERHEALKKAMANYRDMTSDIRSALEELGFTITSDGKHHKLIYCNDSRYQISISKTSSDHRSGLNAVSIITSRMM